MVASMENIDGRYRVFVLEYIKDFHPAKAAERAGLPASLGEKLLADPKVQAAVTAAMDARIVRTQIDSDWVLQQLAQMFEADLADLFVPGSHVMRPVHEWPEIWRKLCSGIRVSESMTGSLVKNVNSIDRLQILEKIGKHVNVKAFSERVEVTTDQTLTQRLINGRKRARERNLGPNEDTPDSPDENNGELSFL